MSNINRVILQGRLTAKPELKNAGGFELCEFTVAWSDKYKDIEKKCFLRCKAWRGTAKFLTQYFDKGTPIIIEGYLVTEEWEKDGQKQSRTICNAEKIAFCGGNKADSTNNSSTSDSSSNNDFMSIPDGVAEELPFN